MRIVYALVFVFGVCAPAVAQEAKSAPPELTQAAERHSLRASVWTLQKENAELRASLSEREARLASIALNASAPALQFEQEQLAAFLRATVCGNDLINAPIDWSQSPPAVTCPKKDR